MEDPGTVDRRGVSLLPGFRFYPTEDQLFEFYLQNKNTKPSDSGDYNLIRELDLYSYLPFELPDSACFPYGCRGRKRHWYCYAVGALSGRRSRRAKGGFWRRTGKVRDVMGGRGGSVLLGTRTRFVFYVENSKKSFIRTDWIMYEYALVDHVKDSFVVCRVFVKPRSGNCISDNLTKPYADESTIAVPNRGHLTPDCATPLTVVSELNNCVRQGLVSNVDSGFHPESQLGDLVRSPGPMNSGPISFDGIGTQDLASILEEDYIELDDLVNPLPGID